MYTKTQYLQDVDYEVDEYIFKTVPGLMLYDFFLEVRIDRSDSRGGEWYIEGMYILGENKSVTRFIPGDWLFDTLIAEIDKDYKMGELITSECSLDS